MARPLSSPVPHFKWVYCDPSNVFVVDDYALAMMADFEAQLDTQSPPGEGDDDYNFHLME